ncbi:MAG: hypothetical protein HRU34_02185 [Richelia sp.]|nr:hypothetical protein [Richelia sp.]CDN14431.1 hypothetical protein RintRC_1473 [Richelia intracellularis]
MRLAARLSQLNHELLTSESNLNKENIAVDSNYISWAEYQLFLNENNSDSYPKTLENKKQANQPARGISFWDANRLGATLLVRRGVELRQVLEEVEG